MVSFESPGVWWLPAQPDRRVPGVLRKPADAPIAVYLFQTLEDGKANLERNAYPVVHGLLHESPLPGGASVSLFDAFATSLSFTEEGATETIVANRAYIGDRHIDSTQASFRACEATFTGFDAWTRLSALSPKHDRSEGSVSIRSATAREAVTIDGTTLEFIAKGFVHYAPDEISFNNRRHVAFHLGRASTHDEVVRELLVPLRNLLSLATGGVERLLSCSIVLGGDEPWPETIHDLGPWERSHEPEGNRSTRVRNPRIPWPETQLELQSLISRWWAITAAHRRAVDFAFALLSEPPKYVEIRFAAASMAMDGLLQRFAAGDAVGFLESLGDGVHAALGPPANFFSRWHRARAETCMWDQPSDSHELIDLTHVLLELVRLVLLTELKVDLEPSLKSPEFQHWTQRLRASSHDRA